MLCFIDYWWIDSIQFDRCPDLAFIMFNDKTKGIRKAMSTKITLPHCTYLSCIFRKLGINTHGDSLITQNQPIIYRALHHFDYHFDANSGEWIKSGLSTAHEDNNVEGAFEDVPSPEHIPPLAAYSFFDINVAILDAPLFE